MSMNATDRSVQKAASVAVIGAGPGGLMAAEILARHGFAVTIYDRMPSPGRKLLMAGRGGLNLTHSEPLPDFLSRYGQSRPRLEAAITDFPPEALRAWAQALGQETFIGSSGRIFPKALKASPLLRAWLQELNRLGVTFRYRYEWRGWDDDMTLLFTTDEGRTETHHAAATILCLGGASWPRLGSTGAWRDMLLKHGLAISPFEPANCGFVVDWSQNFQDRFQGQPLKNIALSFAGATVRGELMATHYGVEGGAIYALSAALRDSIRNTGTAKLHIDLRPDLSQHALQSRLNKAKPGESRSNILRKYAGLSALATNILREAVALTDQSPDTLAALIKNVPLNLCGVQPLDRAISSAGGVAWADLDDQFMLRKKPGVFVAGEMIDWEAPTGGYLLQATFATARAAALGAIKWLNSIT